VNGRIYVITLTRQLRCFIVEDIRSARRFLRLIDREFPIDDTVFFELNEHTRSSDIDHYLDPVARGINIGLLSEAGLPGIADPGALIVALAHKKGITVTPLSVKPAERSAKLRELEKKGSEGCAQIFMETPYRNQKLLETIISVCRSETMLCIATDITLESESIVTKSIAYWGKNLPDLKDRLVVFVMQ
jgi:16S rRNA (cytidine1402-2'-O)-methyltransferase